MQLEKVFDIQSIDEVAYELIKNAQTKTILFYGEMGAGKTTLIRAIVKALGGSTEVSSPTFSIVNEYQVKNDKVYHFDFYRINDVHEALDIGIEDYFYSDAWCLIEWPNNIENLLPLDAVEIHLYHAADGKRSIQLIQN